MRLLQQCDSRGITWANGDLATEHLEYYVNKFKSDTCIGCYHRSYITFGRPSEYEDKIIIPIR